MVAVDLLEKKDAKRNRRRRIKRKGGAIWIVRMIVEEGKGIEDIENIEKVF